MELLEPFSCWSEAHAAFARRGNEMNLLLPSGWGTGAAPRRLFVHTRSEYINWAQAMHRVSAEPVEHVFEQTTVPPVGLSVTSGGLRPRDVEKHVLLAT